MATSPAARARNSLALLVAAGAYFAVAAPLGIELVDEGQIYYPSWAVAEGAIPYRDFRHLYGPALFFVNGAVLRWLGEDVLSIRLSLVVLKSAIGLIVYLLARRVASPPFALLAWACFVATWGSPLVFNGPYANHYALAACCLGLLLHLSYRDRPLFACALAGVCFGAAGTFKQTTGVFGLLSFLLFLLLEPGAAATPREAPRIPAWVGRVISRAIPCAMIALLVVYVWRHVGSPEVALLVTPAMMLAGAALAGGRRSDEALERMVRRVACAVAGAALLPAVVAAYFATRGVLAEVLRDLIVELPAVMRPYVFYPAPDARALLALTALAALFAAAWFRRRTDRLRGWGALALLVLGAAAAAALVHRASGGDLREYVGGRALVLDAVRLWFFVPFVTLFFTAFVLHRARRANDSAGAERAPTDEPARLGALGLIGCSAAVGPTYLYPASDFWHVLMSLPYYLPLIAHLFERFVGRDGAARRARLAAIGVTCALMVAPSVQVLLDARRYATSRHLARATHITGIEPHFGQIADLVDVLGRTGTPGDPMLVTSGEQMLYFLAGRRSVAERDEFILYLVTMDHISADDARRLIDQRRIVERIADRRPLIVERERSPGSKRFRRVFPELAAYVDAHYRPTAAIGRYRVLEFHG